ncbi:PAAR domain-containing protein [Pectobacterium parmentieri]|uniref:PAAR domain-containing protein n=1 Tax=Pectobacterium parmentieri TaxID=1905730 RepID=A0A0H3I546_PECPM|nr:PAAR domain-containing protein [Pectobacterium parmentieri]AFI89813.1 PAAR motif family protein [Pectobacterium parmentieri]MBI0469225.1 PAAR domain-containing protein [Pectobacterium parmentieri]MBI0491850.1 PAAR domain-containing protein [Pectobacterium parmentieri]MBI0553133.1 PAAR domain-containing protein [Pectobacterium parmentieri]MBI0566470.1 PAAR domain-containing protein [Pectobacterium parmentieri]
MSKPLIVLGDKTDHGGVVTTACSGFKNQGAIVACAGDTVVCPQHGTTVIVGHAQGFSINGKGVAREGDKTSCGASLIASRHSVTHAG